MGRFAPSFCFVVLSLAAICVADGEDTNASWGGWKVSTGEASWFGTRHSSYPIPLMFDNSPSTAWVFSGTFADPNATEEVDGKVISRKLRSFEDRNWIHIGRTTPIVLDEIRIMNGYNKNRATFSRNARIVKIDIFNSNSAYTGEQKPIKTVSLSDTMGWHSISLPKRAYQGIKIVVRDINRGTDPDIAISELELRRSNRSVGPTKPDYYFYSPGHDC